MSYIDWSGRVLVIDDSPEVVDVFTKILTRKPHCMEVLTVSTLAEGLRLLRSDVDIDCTILDLQLPDVALSDAMSGKSIRAVRDASRRPMPLVVVTGHPQIPKSIGPDAAQEWLCKPVHPLERVGWAVRLAVSYFHGANDALNLTQTQLAARVAQVRDEADDGFAAAASTLP